MRSQIVNLIISGSTKEQVRSITGISEEALDELLAERSFASEIREVREAMQEQEIDRHYSKLELKALKAVENNMEFYDAPSLCRVMETVARTRQLKKAQSAPLPQNGILHPTININLPTFLGTSQVLLDSNRQVVSIDGRSMAPLPTAQVKQLFNSLSGESHEQSTERSEAEGSTSQTSSRAAA